MTTQRKRTKYAGPLAVAWSLIALLNASQLLLSDDNPGGFGDTLTGLLLVANVGLAAVYGVAWYRQSRT